MAVMVNADRRDRYRAVFTRLDPKRAVHGMNFRDSGYVGCKIGDWGMRELARTLEWCNDTYGDRYAYLGDTFWFLDEDDAFLFRMTWSL